MNDIARMYLYFLIFALVTLVGAVAVTAITAYTTASAQTPDEKAVAWFDLFNALLMLGALTLAFALMAVGYATSISDDALRYFLAHRLIGFSLTAGFFTCIAVKKYSLLPFRYWFVTHFGVLPVSARRILLRRTTQVTLDDMLQDAAMLTTAERSILLQRLTGKEV